jgi:hypothetical protein
LVSPGEGWSRSAVALSHLSRLFSRRTAIHTTTGTRRVINKITAIADSNQAFAPETCLPNVSDDTFALTVTRTAMPPYHPGSGIRRRFLNVPHPGPEPLAGRHSVHPGELGEHHHADAGHARHRLRGVMSGGSRAGTV